MVQLSFDRFAQQLRQKATAKYQSKLFSPTAEICRSRQPNVIPCTMDSLQSLVMWNVGNKCAFSIERTIDDINAKLIFPCGTILNLSLNFMRINSAYLSKLDVRRTCMGHEFTYSLIGDKVRRKIATSVWRTKRRSDSTEWISIYWASNASECKKKRNKPN